MKRIAIALISLGLVACNGDRLTGVDARKAAEQYGELALSNTPLVFLDGREIGNDAVLNMDRENIEAVEVVKGRAALEKYGTRARNGVILITSKAGR
jgi:hypothetical protein